MPDLTYLGPVLRRIATEAGYEMKNKAYRGCPVGQAVGRYLDGIQFGCSPATLESYEDVLGWLSLMHDDLADVQVLADSPDMVERFLYVRWGAAAENTKAHHWKVLNLFFRWCLETGLVSSNPMRGIRRPKNPRNARERQAYRQDIVATLIAAQPTLRDRCALGLLRLAIRKNDLRMLRLGEINLALDQVFLNHAKGGKRHRLPIVFEDLFSDLGAHLAERTLERGADPGDEYLLYARERRSQPMSPPGVHRWFKRCLEQAGLPTSVQMHELRHTAADHIWRTTGNLVLAQKLLRHESPATTAAYLHPTEDDLRAGLRLVEEGWQR